MEENKIEFFEQNSMKGEKEVKNYQKKVNNGGVFFFVANIVLLLLIIFGGVVGAFFGIFGAIVFPIYFVILAVRYSREKSNMYILDKIMFYILLVVIGGFFILALTKM